MEKIATISRRCRILFTILGVAALVCTLGMWLFMSPNLAALLGVSEPVTITPLTKVLGLVITLIPLGIIFYGLRQLIILFKHYERGEIFTLLNALILRKIGFLFYVWIGCQVVYSTLFILVLTFKNPPGQKILQISVGSDSILPFVVGSIIILISWVLVEAQKVSDEHALIP
ncbi:DUF2975 domain-containing protein [Endozoicomonas sp. SM1973]|uniref:DUF2975 domain-containing protein n=1 Tax=Spartinivicinus marinus TaxID=2994442 RepID=A0A853IGY4_9GAMM|nr:DUF2975 domain-containing protein [Spartinivicinus marinus]MCX4026185.1 DUF2975 domain-containing protein [Spartinivicinus marinus]NYZ68717.1 DUF2975 domain-containing protein [Spartinivicinus marinus]